MYAYNVQPDISIDYSNGNSELSKEVKNPVNEKKQTLAQTSPSAPVSAPVKNQQNAPVSAPVENQQNAPVSAPVENQQNASVSAPAENQQNAPVSAPAENQQKSNYILNTRSDKFHYPYCSSVKQMSEKNKRTYSGTREEVINQGFSPCKRCNP